MTQKYFKVNQNQRSSLEVSVFVGDNPSPFFFLFFFFFNPSPFFAGTGRKVVRGGVGVMGGIHQGQKCEVLIRTD